MYTYEHISKERFDLFQFSVPCSEGKVLTLAWQLKSREMQGVTQLFTFKLEVNFSSQRIGPPPIFLVSITVVFYSSIESHDLRELEFVSLKI